MPEIVTGYFTVGWQQIVLLNVLCVAVASGALSPLIVSNRMGFFSDAIAHSTLAGVALGLLLGINPVMSMIGAGVVVALLIAAMRQKSGLSVDALLGVALAGSLAIGVILCHFARGYADMHAYLFGRLTFLDSGDLVALCGAALLSLLVVALYSNQFALLAVSRPLAKSRGVKAARYDFILIVLLGLVVSVCVRAVGLLLVNALMVIPAATSKNFARSYRGMCWGALGVSLLASMGGLFAGGVFKIPEGPAIVVIGVAIFLVSYVWRMATHGMGEV